MIVHSKCFWLCIWLVDCLQCNRLNLVPDSSLFVYNQVALRHQVKVIPIQLLCNPYYNTLYPRFLQWNCSHLVLSLSLSCIQEDVVQAPSKTLYYIIWGCVYYVTLYLIPTTHFCLVLTLYYVTAFYQLTNQAQSKNALLQRCIKPTMDCLPNYYF